MVDDRSGRLLFTVEYPVSFPGYDAALLGRSGLTDAVTAIERSGFSAVAFTEHPAPSAKWMDAGGHESVDVTAALCFCAAVSERLTLVPYVLVLPLYNPFYAAKLLTTLDRVSDGRLLLVAGTGYLRSEFRALNVDMSIRNELFDEAVTAMRGAWTGVPYAHEGVNFHASAVVQRPPPVQHGGPPILVAGNGRRARQRAAELDGWSPLLIGEPTATTIRTPPLPTIEDFARGVADVRHRAERAGRDPAALQFQVQTPQSGYVAGTGSAEEHLDHLGRLHEAGATRIVLQPPARSLVGFVDAVHSYGETIIGRAA